MRRLDDQEKIMSTDSQTIFSDASARAKHRCPVNGVIYPRVSERTMLHHLKAPWNEKIDDQHYYYCDDPECEVMYFNERDETIHVARLRTEVGTKSRCPGDTICYCFGVTSREAEETPRLRTYIVKQTKAGKCACEVRNPFGRCCLKDFPR